MRLGQDQACSCSPTAAPIGATHPQAAAHAGQPLAKAQPHWAPSQLPSLSASPTCPRAEGPQQRCGNVAPARTKAPWGRSAWGGGRKPGRARVPAEPRWHGQHSPSPGRATGDLTRHRGTGAPHWVRAPGLRRRLTPSLWASGTPWANGSPSPWPAIRSHVTNQGGQAPAPSGKATRPGPGLRGQHPGSPDLRAGALDRDTAIPPVLGRGARSARSHGLPPSTPAGREGRGRGLRFSSEPCTCTAAAPRSAPPEGGPAGGRAHPSSRRGLWGRAGAARRSLAAQGCGASARGAGGLYLTSAAAGAARRPRMSSSRRGGCMAASAASGPGGRVRAESPEVARL